jgi:hypothetical protein
MKYKTICGKSDLFFFHYILNVCYDSDHIENTASDSPIVAGIFVAAGKCLTSRCVAMEVSSGSDILTFRRRVTLLPP